MPPKVLLISCGRNLSRGKALMENDWPSVVEMLTKRSELQTITSADEIEGTITEFKPSAIIAMEGGLDSLSPKLNAATPTLAAFAKKGGIIVYGGPISAVATKDDLDTIFGEKGFNIGWEFGKYVGWNADGWDGTFKGDYKKKLMASLNRKAEVFLKNSLNLQSAQLPDEIDPIRPILMKVTNPAHVLYRIVDPQVKEYAKEYAKNYGAGVMAPFGEGFVGFWGDRDNCAAQTADVICAMLGLPPQQQQ